MAAAHGHGKQKVEEKYKIWAHIGSTYTIKAYPENRRNERQKYIPSVNTFPRELWDMIASYTALQCTELICTVLHCTELHFTELHYTALYWLALYCTALYWTELHCTSLYCTLLHCTESVHRREEGSTRKYQYPVIFRHFPSRVRVQTLSNL